jgi:hypothetical protein
MWRAISWRISPERGQAPIGVAREADARGCRYGVRFSPHGVDMWPVELKRPPHFMMPINNQSTSRTLSPKRNGRLQHWRTIANWATLLRPLPCQHPEDSMRREARLRPEYAHLYPMLEPSRWEPASVTAEKVISTRLLQLADTFVLHDRVLVDAHFEFRGGSARRGGSGSGRGKAACVLSPTGPHDPAGQGQR